MNYGKTFFPNSRKEITVENIGLLNHTSGPRIKLAVSMALDDGKQVGMPSWVGDAYDDLARLDSLASAVKFADFELSEMTIYAHTGAETVKPAQTFISPAMTSFSVQRGEIPKKEGALHSVTLEFIAYINGSLEAWSWLYRHFRPATFYMLFLNTQQDLDEPKSPDPQMTLVPEKDSADDTEFEHQVLGRVRSAVTQ